MSITSDLRSYADKAVGATTDLRTTVEKAVNIDAIRAAVEPYLTQARSYGTQVTDRAEDLYTGIKSDKRVAKLVGTVDSVSGVLVETVQDRVVKPVISLTGLGGRPAAKKPVATKPAATKSAATKSTQA